MPQPIPAGYHAITPSLAFKDTQKAIDFYKKAFNAKVTGVFKAPNGKGIMHATIQVGDSVLMMGDEMEHCKSAETMGGTPVSLFLYVNDVDATFKQAVAAGAKETMPVAEMFWGDRAGNLIDPFGYAWMVATHTKDLTDEQVRKGAEAFFSSVAGKK